MKKVLLKNLKVIAVISFLYFLSISIFSLTYIKDNSDFFLTQILALGYYLVFGMFYILGLIMLNVIVKTSINKEKIYFGSLIITSALVGIINFQEFNFDYLMILFFANFLSIGLVYFSYKILK